MNTERLTDWQRKAQVHAALADASRLQIVDLLSNSDLSSSELALALDLPSNLLAHHLKALETAGLVRRTRSEGDRRRTYLRLVPDALTGLAPSTTGATTAMDLPERVLFVCTANSARSHLAAALWAAASDVPAASAGTDPGEHIDPGAIAAAKRHLLPLLPDAHPQRFDAVSRRGDLVVTVCDLAHEGLGALLPTGASRRSTLHWSVPDPVPTGTVAAFDAAYDLLDERVSGLARRLPAAS